MILHLAVLEQYRHMMDRQTHDDSIDHASIASDCKSCFRDTSYANLGVVCHM